MVLEMIDGFFKNEDCPSSYDLLAYQRGDLEKAYVVELGRHLTLCEFCMAELEFYSHYPQLDESADTTDLGAIPPPLLQLAEALLRNGRHDSTTLDPLIEHIGALAFDKA
jgi:hypothetical protein